MSEREENIFCAVYPFHFKVDSSLISFFDSLSLGETSISPFRRRISIPTFFNNRLVESQMEDEREKEGKELLGILLCASELCLVLFFLSSAKGRRGLYYCVSCLGTPGVHGRYKIVVFCRCFEVFF